jgi:uncharacterized protein (TIGR03086 family)
MFDLAPAAGEMTRLVVRVSDDQLDAPTPCSDWRIADLLAHIHEFVTVFTSNARKAGVPRPRGQPDDWRTALPRGLDDLALAWQDTSAWEGRVSAGGVEMSAEENAVVALEELVVHGWDLGRASDQVVRAGGAALDAVDRFLEIFAGPIASGAGPYGPAVAVPAAASRLDRLIGAAGRDPAWATR